MGSRSLSSRTVTVKGNGLPELMGQPALVLSKLSGTERLCELFEYELELKTPDDRQALFGPAADLDTKALRGQELTVTIQLDGMGTGMAGGVGAGTREITGMVTDVRGPIAVGHQIVYRLILRPWLWLAILTKDFRIFQQQSAVEILDTLLSDYTFPVERRLDVARYPKREYQCYTFTSAQKYVAQFPEPPKPGKGNLELFNHYANRLGIDGGDFTVEDALGKVTTGKLDTKGFAAVSGIAPGPARVSFGKDPTDTWAEGSYVAKPTWPPAGASADGAGALTQASGIAVGTAAGAMASQVLAAAGQATQALQLAQQVAGAVKAGPAGLVGLGLSGAQSLLGEAMPTAGTPTLAKASPHPTQTTMRVPGFV